MDYSTRGSTVKLFFYSIDIEMILTNTKLMMKKTLPAKPSTVWYEHEGYVPFLAITTWSFPHSWIAITLVAKVTPRLSLVEQELLTLPGQMRYLWFLGCSCCSIFMFSVYYFVYNCSIFCPFSHCHCLIYASSVDRFWSSLSYFQTIL